MDREAPLGGKSYRELCDALNSAPHEFDEETGRLVIRAGSAKDAERLARMWDRESRRARAHRYVPRRTELPNALLHEARRAARAPRSTEPGTTAGRSAGEWSSRTAVVFII